MLVSPLSCPYIPQSSAGWGEARSPRSEGPPSEPSNLLSALQLLPLKNVEQQYDIVSTALDAHIGEKINTAQYASASPETQVGILMGAFDDIEYIIASLVNDNAGRKLTSHQQEQIGRFRGMQTKVLNLIQSIVSPDVQLSVDELRALLTKDQPLRSKVNQGALLLTALRNNEPLKPLGTPQSPLPEALAGAGDALPGGLSKQKKSELVGSASSKMAQALGQLLQQASGYLASASASPAQGAGQIAAALKLLKRAGALSALTQALSRITGKASAAESAGGQLQQLLQWAAQLQQRAVHVSPLTASLRGAQTNGAASPTGLITR